jgi:hypothetical protein
MRVGVTGHRSLPDRTRQLVESSVYDRLGGLTSEPLVGISCLADGADQLFAEAVLGLGGELEVVLPAAGCYRDGRAALDRFVARAAAVETLGFPESTNEAYMAAGRRVVDRSDVLVAVWDGNPARGFGGTGDVVAYAHERGVPVEVVWPSGAVR